MHRLKKELKTILRKNITGHGLLRAGGLVLFGTSYYFRMEVMRNEQENNTQGDAKKE